MSQYTYPGTDVLINNYGITDFDKLSRMERSITGMRAAQIDDGAVSGRFDAAHVKAIHKYLFQDIYPWAGQFRDVLLFKGGSEFEHPDRIRASLDRLGKDIHWSGLLRQPGRDAVVAGLTDTICELNRIHPFREGNGRTQRLFLKQLSAAAGYELSFSGMSENDMRNASIASFRGNRRLMSYLISSGIEKLPDRPNVTLMDRLRQFAHMRGRADGGCSKNGPDV